ncbi:MAG: bifunctional riboflavin kinase/FAD synthetase [Ignavibacteria bacterium]|nr:bifunctional riboflavin kinase/FAD synthetase [Ignavibacteria bacterium]
MQIYQDFLEVEHNDNTIITLGTFDGIHLGHKEIIEAVVQKATEFGGRSLLITFSPHPRKVILGGNNIKLLSTLSEKKKIIETFGMDNLLIIRFTKEFSQQTPEEFVDKYLINGIGVKEIVIGYDHHFGKGRGGDIEILKKKGKEIGFAVTAVPEYKIDDIIVSSTKIRKALIAGDILSANKMLGCYYSFEGLVVPGDKRGRELGFPTANLLVENEDKLLPATGIYAAECIVEGKKHNALLSIGSRPTFHEAGEIIPEVYIIDFNKQIYNQSVRVNVVDRIRGEEKFSSAEELVKQMKNDKETGLKILKQTN